MSKFTHLHVHSHYSLLDGLAKPEELLDYAKELGMDSLALTDHGVMYGAVEFFQKAKERGIKPIIGCEVYQAYESRQQKRPRIDDTRYHLLLLAKNKKGYENLVKLVTKAHLEGFYYKPRIDEEILEQYSEGLVACTACIQGKIPRLILAKKEEEAKRVALKYKKIFGEDFYLEIQHHPQNEGQVKVNKSIIPMAKELDIPLVATNDVHYLKTEDGQAQDILMMINTGADQNDPERLTMKTEDLSLKSPEEMKKAFKNVPQAIENTQKIAEKCNFELELGKTKLPRFDLPDKKTTEEHLKELCYRGLEEKFGKNYKKEMEDRLEYELSVIKQTGFASYFLIVQDFVNWAKENRIIVGPGRGSVGGSLAAYLLNITNINPLKYDLLFERFLNPERVSMPDIDLDFADRRRDEVISYVAQEYGRERVAQIITFGTMAARAVIRDVGRVLNYSYGYCDKIAKMIPFGFSLEETLKKVKEFKDLYQSDEQAKRLIDLALKLEGVARHASTHACGVVISADPLTNSVPLQRPTQNDETIVTQYEMHAIEDLGLLKMDFLGLKNLTIIEDTLARIYVVRNKEKVDIEEIPLDDEKTFQLLQQGNTTGVFQLEGGGIRRFLKQLKPVKFEDIIAMVALYRPGPMQFLPDFIERRHGRQKTEYLHPKLKPILEETNGICIYQEQLMRIAREIAGFTLSEADILRKAVGKKIEKLLHGQKKKFIEGTVKNGIKKEVGEKIWQWILPFARYGFNKCVTGDTKIINPETGERVKVTDLLNDKKRAKGAFSLSKDLKIKKSKIVDVFSNGRKPVFEVRTKTGKRIKVTKNHPFLTGDGWKKLEEIKVGERVATPRIVPEPSKPVDIEDHKVAILGYLLAEGNFCHPRGFYFYSKSKEEIEDYIRYLEKFDNTLGRKDYKKKAIAVYSKRKNRKEKSEAVEWIRGLGLHNKKATQKFLPEFVFQLPESKVALLAAKMFQGDGCINFKNKLPAIFYSTSSAAIAEAFQSLLLRLGIISVIHKKKFRYREGVKIGYTINISRHDNIQKFIKHLSPYSLKEKKGVLEEIKKAHPILNGTIKPWPARGSRDIVPANIVVDIMRQTAEREMLTFAQISRENSFSKRLFLKDPEKKGYLREAVSFISQSMHSKELEKYATSDVFWDEIASIAPKGTEETFDLTIKDTHNFIANDIFVHNSHSTAYAMIAYQTAYLKAHYPVEFMASLMTSERNDVEKIAILIENAREMDIETLPPSLNESLKNFTVIPDKKQIRFGLLAIKNVGENVVDAIVKEKKERGPFKSIGDFAERMDSGVLNKKSLESLIRAGVFDEFGERNRLFQNMERVLEAVREKSKSKENGQKGLFDGSKFNNHLNLASAEPVSNFKKLGWEKELLGLYISSHPLEDYRNVFKEGALSLAKIGTSLTNRRVRVGGIISGIKKILTKNGKSMLFMQLEDLTGKREVVVFPSIMEKNPDVFEENKVVFVSARVDDRQGEIKLIAEAIEEIVNSS